MFFAPLNKILFFSSTEHVDLAINSTKDYGASDKLSLRMDFLENQIALLSVIDSVIKSTCVT